MKLFDRYKFGKNHKWFEWFDNHILWYVYDKPRDFYRTIKHWFYCNFNKYHWNLLKNAWCSYPWDGSYLTYLEEAQIDKQIYWFKNHQMMVDEQYEQICRTLKWAKHCIHIMNHEADLYHYDGELKFSEPEQVDSDGDLEISTVDTSDLKFVYDGPRVNWKNASRFLTEAQINNEFFRTQHNELYLAKCKHLYYKIRERYTDIWWD